MKHANIKSIVFLLIISFSLILVGCVSETNSDASTNTETSTQETPEDTSTDSSSSETETSTEVMPEKDNTNTQTTTSNTQIIQSGKQLPDVVLSNLKIYDLGQKKDVAIEDPIIASNPLEMSITLKNQGTAAYQDGKGNAPILIFMITPAHTGNLYFYSNNYTPLSPGDERVYKTNAIKFRTTGTHNFRIYPNIQYISTQPEELNIENNEINVELTIKTK